MKITALKRRKGARDRLNVYLDGRYAFAVSEEVAIRAGLRPGRAVDEELLASLRAQETDWSIRSAALKLLSYRQRSVAELRDRLRAKAFPPDAIESCISELERSKLLDDAEFARSFVRDRVRGRPRGRRVLLAELRARGVDDALSTRVITEILEEIGPESEAELARRAARRFRPRQNETPSGRRRRLHAFLARKGFGHDAIRTVLDEHET